MAAAGASALTFTLSSTRCLCSPPLPASAALSLSHSFRSIAPPALTSQTSLRADHALVRPFCEKFEIHRGASGNWRCDCSVENGRGDESREEQHAELLEDEESRALLRDLAAATKRVSAARSELDVISRQEQLLSDFKARLEQMEVIDLVAGCEKDLAAAHAEVAAAKLSLAAAEAENSTFTCRNTSNTQEVNKNLERLYSTQAAAVSALSGVSASLPFAVASGQDLDLNFFLSEGCILVICALFGISFRYMVRRNLNNIQLKAGAAAAFSLVRGLGQIETAQMLAGCPKEGCHEFLLTATLNACQSFFIFFFAALVLDLCLKGGLLRPVLADEL